MINTYIHVSFSFEGLHCWPEAPDTVEFLRTPHRHLFEGHAHIQVFHDDHELEYFLVKKTIDTLLLSAQFPYDLGTLSCEQMARAILEYLRVRYGNNRNMKVEILEDGENGSIVKYKGQPIPLDEQVRRDP